MDTVIIWIDVMFISECDVTASWWAGDIGLLWQDINIDFMGDFNGAREVVRATRSDGEWKRIHIESRWTNVVEGLRFGNTFTQTIPFPLKLLFISKLNLGCVETIEASIRFQFCIVLVPYSTLPHR